jgi:hypothetical protein
MKVIFEAIQNKLDTDVTALQFIDFDLGQLEQEPLPPLDYPACLISFGESPFIDFGQLSQQATMLINIRLAFRVFERTHNIAQAQYRAIGLSHLDTIEAVKWALHGLSGTDFTELSHRGFSTEPRADLRVYSLTFETLLTVTPPTQPYVPWADAGGAGAGPDFCVQDEDGNPIT